MRKVVKYLSGALLLSFAILISGKGQIDRREDNLTAFKVNSLIDKIIRESTFRFVSRQQKSNEEIQVIDFSRNLNHYQGDFGYAMSIIHADRDKEITLGLSFSAPVTIWLNGKHVFSDASTGQFDFAEFAYDMYQFQEKISLNCNKGDNTILVRMQLTPCAKIYLAAIDDADRINESVHFSLDNLVSKADSKWMICGPFSQTEVSALKPFPVEQGYSPYYTCQEHAFGWNTPERPLVLTMDILADASFKKHSYLEWHYSNGALMWALLAYAKAANNVPYQDYVKRFCRFTLDHLDYFRFQYESLHEIHGFNHRIFRMSMLDDASAPALPFMQLVMDGNLNEGNQWIDTIANYLLNGQVRLPDGTFCRPEPESGSVWADDLFMSAPFLMMYGQYKHDASYYYEATNQIKLFYEHLFDTDKGLCHHGSIDNGMGIIYPYWSRANGWMIWALSETLAKLPREHPDYKDLQRLYKSHITGLISCQDSTGFLHQLLDQPASFTETSSTAMFTLALARGINNGWIRKDYKKQALAGWRAVSSRISEDGTVTGICEGTSMSSDPLYYLNRKMPDHDPRGLGAVIMAGYEISRMLSR